MFSFVLNLASCCLAESTICRLGFRAGRLLLLLGLARALQSLNEESSVQCVDKGVHGGDVTSSSKPQP